MKGEMMDQQSSQRVARLRQIADEIRSLPRIRACDNLALQAGQLFREALDLGAFPGPEHAELRNEVRYPVARATSDLAASAFVNQWRVEDKTGYVQAWDEAVKYLVPRVWTELHPTAPGGRIIYDPMQTDIGRAQCWRVACDPIANLIAAEAERLAVAEEADSTPPAAKTEQVEGDGGDRSTPEQPAIVSPADREAVFRSLEPAVRKAYLAFQYAETMNGRRMEAQEAYDWLKENGIDAEKGDLGELTDYEPPAFDNWARYDRTARNALREQRYQKRAGRTGRSIVRGREIEHQRGDNE